MARQTLWGFGGCECEYNFCDMARTLRIGENAFRGSCNFRELFGFDQGVLGFFQVPQRCLGRVPGATYLVLAALAFADVDVSADPAIDGGG